MSSTPVLRRIFEGRVQQHIPARFGSSWRKRYLVLTTETVHIHKSEKGTQTESSPVYKLEQFRIVSIKSLGKSTTSSFVIEFWDPRQRSLQFKCDNHEAVAWQQAIQTEMTRHASFQAAQSACQKPSMTVLDKWLDRLQLTYRASIRNSRYDFGRQIHHLPRSTSLPDTKAVAAAQARERYSHYQTSERSEDVFTSISSIPSCSSSSTSLAPSCSTSHTTSNGTPRGWTSPLPPPRRCATQVGRNTAGVKRSRSLFTIQPRPMASRAIAQDV